MLNEFLKVAHASAQRSESSSELSSLMAQAFTKEELYGLATGQTKLAHLCEPEGTGTSSGSWLSRFQGTPLFDQALMLEEEGLQKEQENLQFSAQTQAQDQTRQMFWQGQDQLRLKKRLLDLELAKLQEQAAMSAAPTAVPTTGAPEPPVAEAQGAGAASETPPEKVVQAQAKPELVLKERLWKVAGVAQKTGHQKEAFAVTEKGHEYDAAMNELAARHAAEAQAVSDHFTGGRLALSDEAKKHIKDQGSVGSSSLLDILRFGGAHDMASRHDAYTAEKHRQGKNAFNPFGGLMTPTKHEVGGSPWVMGAYKTTGKEHKKEAGFFGMGPSSVGRVGGLLGSAKSALRPAAYAASKAVPNTIGNLAENVKSPFGPRQSVDQLFSHMKSMGQPAPARPASPNLSGVNMHQGTLRGAVNQATGAVGDAARSAAGAVGNAASSVGNAVSGMAGKARGWLDRLTPTARMQNAYSAQPNQAYPLKFAEALTKISTAGDLGKAALGFLKENPQAAARVAGGVVGGGIGALTGPKDQGAGSRVLRGLGGAAVGAGLGHAAASPGAQMLVGAAREGHLGEALKGTARGVKDRLMGLAGQPALARMLNVTHAVVRSLDVDLLEVSWCIDDLVEDVYDYTFQVVRSESPMGPFEALSEPFQDRYIFVDNRTQPFSFNRIYFYKILITHKPTGCQEEFGPYSAEAEPDLITLELRRHLQLLYREFTGRRCWLLPARTFGQRCECWDSTLQKRTRSGCRTCYDTGFVYGYLSPIEVWAQFDPNPKNEQATNIGTIESSVSTMRLVDFPPVKPRDVVVESENRRWRVNTVTPVEHVRATVLQEVTVNEIPHSDMEYVIPLKLDRALRDLWLSPARNFTNPQNLDNFVDEEIPRLMSLYGYPSSK